MTTYQIKKQFCASVFLLTILASCGKKEDSEAVQAQKADSLKKAETTKDLIMGVARVEPQDGIVNIYAGTSGKLTSVLIKENQLISKGGALGTIDVAIETAQLAQAESKVGTQNASIATARATVDALKVGLKNALNSYNRNLALFEGNAQTKQVLDDSKAAVERYEKDIQTAEATLSQTSARVKELQADINYYKTLISQKRIYSPFNGRVLNVLANPGDYVNATTVLAEFAPAGGLVARTEVDELYADRIVLGQRAVVLSQTTGDTLAKGIVSFAAEYLKQKSLFKDQSTEQEDRRVREVHIKIEGDKKLLIGSRVDCTIILK